MEHTKGYLEVLGKSPSLSLFLCCNNKIDLSWSAVLIIPYWIDLATGWMRPLFFGEVFGRVSYNTNQIDVLQ